MDTTIPCHTPLTTPQTRDPTILHISPRVYFRGIYVAMVVSSVGNTSNLASPRVSKGVCDWGQSAYVDVDGGFRFLFEEVRPRPITL